MGKSDADEEGNDTGDGLELSDLNIVVCGTCACRDEEFLLTVTGDCPHDPDAVITGTFLVCSLLAQDFSATTALHEIAESGFSDHIRCFNVPVHICGHTSHSPRRMIALPTIGIAIIRKYIIEMQDILLLIRYGISRRPDRSEGHDMLNYVVDFEKEMKMLHSIPQIILLSIVDASSISGHCLTPPPLIVPLDVYLVFDRHSQDIITHLVAP